MNSVVTYYCNTGYALQGSETRRCASNGRWTGTAPECIGKTLCVCVRACVCVVRVCCACVCLCVCMCVVCVCACVCLCLCVCMCVVCLCVLCLCVVCEYMENFMVRW